MNRTIPFFRSRRAFLASGASLAFFLVAGCGEADSVHCTSESVHALDISVIDAVTRAPVTNALGLAISSDHHEELRRWESRLVGPENRRGMYTVIVSAQGYSDWIREGIPAPIADPCPRSVELVAEMVPL